MVDAAHIRFLMGDGMQQTCAAHTHLLAHIHLLAHNHLLAHIHLLAWNFIT